MPEKLNGNKTDIYNSLNHEYITIRVYKWFLESKNENGYYKENMVCLW